MVKTAFVGLGSNLGDRLEFLARALRSLAAAEGVTVTEVSSVYESRPVGPVEQEDFLNAVARIETDLEAEDLLAVVQTIENKLGRQRTVRWGPRRIDIDLLLYEDEVVKTETLTLPHPEMMNRAFVLVPLAEIAPDLELPNGKPVRQAADSIEAAGLKKAGKIEA